MLKGHSTRKKKHFGVCFVSEGAWGPPIQNQIIIITSIYCVLSWEDNQQKWALLWYIDEEKSNGEDDECVEDLKHGFWNNGH